ncbi:ribonuclease Z [Zhenpiania hominis]|uniref:ribonuclease Z n=1 Tax=Zhenpiania hominis TaxID=2763644 RepID=UPI0039F5A012
MILVACADDNLGMLFHGRRQSRDRRVREAVLESCGKRPLWMNRYSAKQFADRKGDVRIHEDFLFKAGPGDWCFVETDSARAVEKRIETIVLYRWNRVYPADFWFDIPLAEHGWNLVETSDFKGFSHEKITKEIYIK